MPASDGLLRSLEKSVQEPVDTIVTGQIPLWLNGTLFRNVIFFQNLFFCKVDID
jgi:hypothetical protein